MCRGQHGVKCINVPYQPLALIVLICIRHGYGRNKKKQAPPKPHPPIIMFVCLELKLKS